MPVSKNAYLTQAEQEENATYIWWHLIVQGWTTNAVAGMLGNMEVESTINPGIWQRLKEGNLDGGYGLTQWTPASRYIDWCNENGYDIGSMDVALIRIEGERNGTYEQWYPTAAYPETFDEFSRSLKTTEYLAVCFCRNYERPSDPDLDLRRQNANDWYEYLTGQPPEPEPTIGKSMKWIYYLPNIKRRY